MKPEKLICPRCHADMELRSANVALTYRGREVAVEAMAYVCPVCGLEFDTVETVRALQFAIECQLVDRSGKN